MSDRNTSRSRRRWVWLTVILVLVVVASIVGIPYLTSERKPLPEATAALRSDPLVDVSMDPWLTFEPTGASPEAGFIFYPGGRIDPAGYCSLDESHRC